MKRWIDNQSVSMKLSLNLIVVVISVLVIAISALVGLRTAMETERRTMIKNAVEVAASYAQGLENQVQQGKMTRGQALSQFAQVMAAARYDNNKYFAAYFTDGTYLFHGTSAKLAGHNELNSTDISGRHFMRESIDVATKQGGGYYNIAVVQQNEKDTKQKVNYAKIIPAWGLVIVSGMVISDINATVLDVAERMAIFGVPILILSFGLLFLIRSSIGGGLNTASHAMLQLAEGHLGVEIPSVRRKDEVGTICRALVVFKDAAGHRLRLEEEAVQRRGVEAEERALREAEASEAARRQTQVVGAMAVGLERLAKGDLVARLTDQFATEYEELRRHFNLAAETLESAIMEVASTAHTIEAGTSEISSAASDLSRRTEQQAASLEQTAAALDEITATVRKTADGAAQVQAVVSTVKDDAERSDEVVRRAIVAMGEIEKSSQQVGQIVGVIDEIAFQTNLLALNAGVEAARAGDAGRGFAVVASEVRALAQRSADAAREIKKLISTSAAEVGRGVRLVDETGQSLQRIVGHVATVDSAVTEIAASAREQARGLAEVNTAVNHMDQVTQQNAAMVEQSTAASHSLAEEAQALTRLTGHFQIGGPAPAPAPISRQARSAAPIVARAAAQGGRGRT
jgi:methyl-accepting chemotaxis protein